MGGVLSRVGGIRKTGGDCIYLVPYLLPFPFSRESRVPGLLDSPFRGNAGGRSGRTVSIYDSPETAQ